MKKLILLSFAFLLFTSINAQTDTAEIVLKPIDNTINKAGKQKKSTKLIQSWKVPNRTWFIEIGTPGIGLSLSACKTGPVVDNIHFANENIKFPSLTVYISDRDTNYSSYTGYGIEYNIISGSFDMSDHVRDLHKDFYTDDFILWSTNCFKYKYRTYTKLSNKFSISGGIGLSYNISSFSSYNFKDVTVPNVYYTIDGVKTETTTNFVIDAGFVWEATKWLNLGLRFDYDTFKIKLPNSTLWGKYDSFSSVRFISISPTIRFKI